MNSGDRVIVGDQLYGTVQQIASDGEVKVLLDGDTVGMYYPAEGVAEIPTAADITYENLLSLHGEMLEKEET